MAINNCTDDNHALPYCYKNTQPAPLACTNSQTDHLPTDDNACKPIDFMLQPLAFTMACNWMEHSQSIDPAHCNIQCSNVKTNNQLPSTWHLLSSTPQHDWCNHEHPPYATMPNTMPQLPHLTILPTWWWAPLLSWHNNHWPYANWRGCLKNFVSACTSSYVPSPPLTHVHHHNATCTQHSTSPHHSCHSKSGIYLDPNAGLCNPLETVASAFTCLLSATSPHPKSLTHKKPVLAWPSVYCRHIAMSETRDSLHLP